MRSFIRAAVVLAALAASAGKPTLELRTDVTRNAGGAFVVGVDVRNDADQSLFTQSVEMKRAAQKVKTPYGEILIEIDKQGFGYATLGRAISIFELDAPAGDVRMRKDAGVEVPKVIQRVEPHYPGQARDARATGVAIVEAKVGTTGLVEGIRIVRDPGYGLGVAAAAAVRQWRFQPATKDGQPVPVLFPVPVAFRLN